MSQTEIFKRVVNLLKELNEKYGAGTLDPQTGEFKPAQS